jgi:hypothetical protein
MKILTAKILTDYIHFPLERYAKFGFDAAEDLFAEIIDFPAGGVPIIDQDECLAAMAACVSAPESFPSTLFDEPAGRQLNARIV